MDTQHVLLAQKVPATVMFALVMQLAGALIWASHLEARVESVERQTSSQAQLNEKFARLEERLESLKVEIGSMRQQVQAMSDTLLGPPKKVR